MYSKTTVYVQIFWFYRTMFVCPLKWKNISARFRCSCGLSFIPGHYLYISEFAKEALSSCYLISKLWKRFEGGTNHSTRNGKQPISSLFRHSLNTKTDLTIDHSVIRRPTAHRSLSQCHSLSSPIAKAFCH